MSLATYYLDYGRHLARLSRRRRRRRRGRRRRRRRRRAYAPTSNIASQDNHEKINSSVSFAFLYLCEYGAPLGGPLGRRSSAIINSGHSKVPRNMELVRKLVLHSMPHNFLVRARHVSKVSNEVADALSRFQMQRFRALAPDANQNPCIIPPSLMTL